MSSPHPQSELFSPPVGEPVRAALGTWTILAYDVVTSTNLVAAKLPAWHAVRADCQTAGRGRFQRSWISNRGGLWLSAVVPIVDKSPQARLLPLTAGLAVSEALRDRYGLSVRLRWPNDVLVGPRKLAGLLIDQFVPGLAVVGIGINVANRPEELEPELRGQTSRLADLVSPEPELGDLLKAVLESLENVCRASQTHGPESLLPRINGLWRTPTPVQVGLDGTIITAQFEGVDAAGRLKLRSEQHGTQFYEPHQVRLLREVN